MFIGERRKNMNKQSFRFFALALLLSIPGTITELSGSYEEVSEVFACFTVLSICAGLYCWARHMRETLPKIERTPREKRTRIARNILCMIAGMVLFVSFFLYLFRNSPEFFSFLIALYKNPITFLPILINLLIPVAAVGIAVMPG